MSGILQEAARRYLDTRRWESLQQELAVKARKAGIRTEEDVDRMIHELRRGSRR